jgi:hypothetical protein
MLSRMGSGFNVLAGEDRGGPVGIWSGLKGDGNCGPGVSRRAAAHGVHYDERCSGLGQRLVDIVGASQLLDPEPRQLVAHRAKKHLWIGHFKS